MTPRLKLYVHEYTGGYGAGIIISAKKSEGTDWKCHGTLAQFVKMVNKEGGYSSYYIE